MEKNQYALIGHPILHSISPFIHKRLFEISKIAAEYKLLDISSENLECSMKILNNFNGYNVTLPHKLGVIKFLDSVSDKSRMYQSVNTVKNSGGSTGFTTDAAGFLKALEYEGLEPKGRAVIMGAGGVASVIANELANKGCDIVIATRDSGIKRAQDLAGLVNKIMGISNVDVCKISEISGPIDLLVNATPVGMYPKKDISPVDTNVLGLCRQVYDVVYNPYETKLVREAKSLGIKSASGLSMLVFQAAASHKIWNESEYSEGDIKQLILDCFSEINRGFE